MLHVLKNKRPHVGSHHNLKYPAAKKQRLKEEEKQENAQLKDPTRLYPLERDDEPDHDDIQEFMAPPSTPPQIPDEVLNSEIHLPKGAIIADGQFPDLKDLEALDSRSSSSKKRGLLLPEPNERPASKKSKTGKININYGPAGAGNDVDKMQLLDYYTPRPFEELMSELTQWYLQSGTDYQIFPFHVMRCCDYLWLAMGKRRTGKTTLWKTVVPEIACMYPFVYVFCGTRFNSAFKAYAPEQVIFKGFREGVVTAILEKQEEKIERNLRLFDKFSEFEDPDALEMIPNPYIHCVFDDCVADKRCHGAECLDEIAMYGRHFRCGQWINTQHGHALAPVMYHFFIYLGIHSTCIVQVWG